jgi:hypothetical protein
MRLPVPGPRDLIQILERGADSVEQLLAAVPRMVRLLDDAERLVERVDALVDRIEETRTGADEAVRRTERVVSEAEGMLTRSGPLVERLGALLDHVEPPLTKLQPTLDRLAETTDPHEVDALVMLIDHLPALAVKMETDIVPVLDSLSTVAPDLHDLLDVSRELNEMLAKLPGMGRLKRRVDEEQELEGRG